MLEFDIKSSAEWTLLQLGEDMRIQDGPVRVQCERVELLKVIFTTELLLCIVAHKG